MFVLKILILEDNPADAGLTVRALKMSDLRYEHRVVDNKDDFIAALLEFKPHVILSDHSLPSFTSEEALPLAHQYCRECVFILVTGTVSEEFAVNILKAGANDYVLKSSLTRLPSAIINAFTKKKAESEREQNILKLQEVNHELKTFMYRASHDIRGPLSSMKGLINIAKIENEPSELMKLIDMMNVSAERMDRIVVDLIETLGVRDMNVVKEEVNLKAIVNEIIAGYTTQTGNKLKFSIESNLQSSFYSDSKIITLVLKRIIDNAVKFQNFSVPGPYVNINIWSNENGASISIADNGAGIKEECLPKVFDMFYRANTESDGIGLGLYLVKIGTDKLDGKIEITSMEQMGTTVILDLPDLALN
ncbi:MAG: hybrid sensor histidine kinase/response regulator [Bacteroidota bacterium]|jgi:K+-sensing histidine kinase KdpD|nr:hybrid sensor histidine kinase/response regulator [Bacteroidota bacterium]